MHAFSTLLATGARYSEVHQAYTIQCLFRQIEPNRFMGLYGAAELAGDHAKATSYYEQLVTLGEMADSERLELAAAQRFWRIIRNTNQLSILDADNANSSCISAALSVCQR